MATTDEGAFQNITLLHKEDVVTDLDMFFTSQWNAAAFEDHVTAANVHTFSDAYCYLSFTENEWEPLNDTRRQAILDGFSTTTTPTNGFINEVIANTPISNMVLIGLNKTCRIQFNDQYGYSISADETIQFTADSSVILDGTQNINASPNFVTSPDTQIGAGTSVEITDLNIGTNGNQQIQSSTLGWTTTQRDEINNNVPYINWVVPDKFEISGKYGLDNIVNPNVTQTIIGGSSFTVSNFDCFTSYNTSQNRFTFRVRVGTKYGNEIGNPTTYFTDLGITTADELYLELLTVP